MTMHEQAAEKMAQRLISTPDGAKLLHLAYTGVTQRWDADYLSYFGQKTRAGQWPLGQVCCFGVLFTSVEAGDIGVVSIRAGGAPQSDANRQANRDLLADLPEPFRADVDMHQRLADDDGRLTWTSPIDIDVALTPHVDDDSGGHAMMGQITIGPASVPLEIGTTYPSRTLLHVREDQGVARWPYDSEWIRLLVSMDYHHPGRPRRLPVDKLTLPSPDELARPVGRKR